MKKFLSVILALVLVLSLGTVAFAENEIAPAEAQEFEFNKEYKTTAGETPATYPAEVLKFVVTARETGAPEITIADHTVDGNPDKVVISIPKISTVGKWNYTVKETAGSTQGVTYATNEFGVQIVASYNEDHTAIETQVVFTTKDGDAKVDTFTNIYDLGSLTVSKAVSGNLGDKTAKFSIDVTFKTENEKTVRSVITYGADKVIAGDWTGEKKVTIELADGESITFNNVPAGVSYTVAEQSKHILAAGETFDPNSAGDKQYTVDYSGNYDGAIAAGDKDACVVENEKKTEVDTGISLDSMPYVVLLTVAALGVAVILTKKFIAE